VLCTPNNPTGNATSTGDVERVLDEIDGVLFLDNAYVEFSGIDYLPLTEESTRTWSSAGRSRKCTRLPASGSGTAFVPAWLQQYYTRAGNAVYGERGIGSSGRQRP